MKILSPAGNFECLKVAVYNGADEVYLGVNQFNARNNIDGFTMQNLKEAVDFAHLYGVKVLLAINILFTNNEMQSALDTIVDGYNMGVDAFIVQDLGLAGLLNKYYPEIELHASTQMGLHNLEGVKAVKKYGFKRVVLARETPLSEIKRIKENCDVEIEYFSHGALCVSFSGNCYMSSYLLDASGNRGRCKQLCRLPYTLQDNGKDIKSGYLLSAKDFDMTERLVELKNAGVDVLKIEGRARRPFYVATTTREYYKALHGETVDRTALNLAFNRNFTQGYFNGNGDIISEIQNHTGIKIGKIEKVKNGKNFNEIIISSDRELSPKSTFKTYQGDKEKNTFTAFDLTLVSKGKYKITSTQKFFVGDTVRLILDADLEKKALENNVKRNININLSFEQDKPAKAVVIGLDKVLTVYGDNCVKALKQPLTKEEIVSNFNKSEYFIPKLNFEVLEDVFMSKQQLNAFRRSVYQGVIDSLTAVNRKPLEKMNIPSPKTTAKFTDFEFVSNENYESRAKNIVYSPEIYSLEKVNKFVKNCLENGKRAYLDTPNFALSKDVELIDEIVKETGVGIIVNNYYSLKLNGEKVIGGYMNVYNDYTAYEHGLKYLVAEKNDKNVTLPYMTLRHCPIKAHLGGSCKDCKYKNGLVYKMENGKKLQLKRKKLSDCTFYLTE